MKKILAVILCVCMMFTLSLGVCADTGIDDSITDAGDIFGATSVYFLDAQVSKGGDVTVDVMLQSNPGVTEIKVTFALPEGISIKSVANGDKGTATLGNNVVTVSDAEVISATDCCIAKVTFTATAEGEKKVTLSATAKNGANNIDVNGLECVINVTASAVVVIPGDVDGNGAVNTTDLAEIKLFLAQIKDEVCEGADLNDDGAVTTTDLAALKLILVANN